MKLKRAYRNPIIFGKSFKSGQTDHQFQDTLSKLWDVSLPVLFMYVHYIVFRDQSNYSVLYLICSIISQGCNQDVLLLYKLSNIPGFIHLQNHLVKIQEFKYSRKLLNTGLQTHPTNFTIFTWHNFELYLQALLTVNSYCKRLRRTEIEFNAPLYIMLQVIFSQPNDLENKEKVKPINISANIFISQQHIINFIVHNSNEFMLGLHS